MPVPIDDLRREKLLIEVARGKTIREASRATGVSERSARRFVTEPQFRATLSTLRRDLIEGLRDELLSSAHEAMARLRELVRSDDQRVALGAAKEILAHVLPARISIDVAPASKGSSFTEDELHELFHRMGSSGLIREAADLEVYTRYRAAFEEAEKDPRWHIVPDGFMPGSEEERRLAQWRRREFPEVFSGWLPLLRLVRSLIASHPEPAALISVEENQHG